MFLPCINKVQVEIFYRGNTVVFLQDDHFQLLPKGVLTEFNLRSSLSAWSSYRAQHPSLVTSHHPSHTHLPAAIVPTSPPDRHYVRTHKQSGSCRQHRFRSDFTGCSAEAAVPAGTASSLNSSDIKLWSSVAKFWLLAEPLVTAAEPSWWSGTAHWRIHHG